MAVRTNKYYGIGLNFGKGQNGYFSISADKRLVKENIKQILLTNPGERIHLPDFGVGLNRYLFEMNDEQLSSVIRQKIIEQVSRYEPLAEIMDIQFKRQDNLMQIRLIYRMKDIASAPEQLVLEQMMS
jgi:phage baseplate assembly protein W